MPTSLPHEPQRKLSAVVFADVEGYAGLMSKDEAGTATRVGRSIGLFRSLIDDYGGEVENVAGDGVLALFDSATRAVRFAVDIQKEFSHDAVWEPSENAIAFRIGVNLGEVIRDQDGIQGHSVNVAARIQALAPPGGICVSEAVYQAVHNELGVRLSSMGPQRLKNIEEPVEVFVVEFQGPQVPPSIRELAREEPPILVPHKASVAALPLVNMSSDPRDEHLSEGITDDIITNLCRFRELLVIARHSAFLFKDLKLSPAEIGRQLNVRYLLTGSLRRADRKIRIAVQLIEAESGRTIWSERYDGDLGDVFAFQDEVTNVIAARLAVQIDAAERRRLSETEPPNLQAYGLILRGQHLSFQFRKEANAHARRLFEQAAEFDPGYGRCYAAMSRTCNFDWRYAWSESPNASLDQAVELAKCAIERDSLDARGYAELGYAFLYKKQHDRSLAAYERAIELNPNDADLLAEMGDFYVYVAQPERGVELLHRAMQLNPYYPDWYLWYLGDAYFQLGKFEETISAVSKMRDQSEAHRLLAASYAQLGHMDDARSQSRKLMEKHPHFSIKHWQHVPPVKDPSDLEQFIEGLRKAGLPE
jgi:TolB-like protein/Flp pilus assembly protein TadD